MASKENQNKETSSKADLGHSVNCTDLDGRGSGSGRRQWLQLMAQTRKQEKTAMFQIPGIPA